MARKAQPFILKWWPVLAFGAAMLSSVLGAWIDMRIQIAEVKTSVAEIQKDVAVTQESVGALSDRLLDMGAQQGARSRRR